jgi:hypothetical protein
MKALFIVCAALALLVCAAIPLKSFAEDEAKMSAAQIAAGQTKAGVANTLIVIGRAAKDPDMMIAAARLLAAIEAPVADPKASSEGKPVFYDVDAIVAEADGYAAKPASRTYEGFCHYEYWCDSLSCSYVWVC